MTQAVFLTGTDTGVGKTVVATGLLAAAAARGLTTLGLKPVAAGCERQDGEWRNADACRLLETASISLDYQCINPVALRPAIAPHIAAAEAGLRLQASVLAGHCTRVLAAATPDFAVVEGAGGWHVPLNSRESMADVAIALGLPVLMVVGMRLGCLNHALLTAESIRRSGLMLAGWVANFPAPMAYAQENEATLRELLPAPCVGSVPPLADDPAAETVAARLDFDLLSASMP